MLKNDRKIGFFLYVEKFCHRFLLETYLNKNWYCYLFYCIYKSHIWGNSCSWITARKAFNKLVCGIQISDSFSIFNSQFITASPLVRSDCSEYWSGGNLQVSQLLFLYMLRDTQMSRSWYILFSTLVYRFWAH